MASCPCGFEQRCTIGGGMTSYRTHSFFPFLCSYCGLVSVNVAEDPPVCPGEPTHKIAQYGGSWRERSEREKAKQALVAARKIPFWERIGLSLPKPATEPQLEARTICQCFDYEILEGQYSCPQCRKETLAFASSGIRYD
jgi:hypothetical protein